HFWPLVVTCCVLDCQRMELELFAQQGDIRFLWVLYIQPDELPLPLDDFADVLGINRARKMTIRTAHNELAGSFHPRVLAPVAVGTSRGLCLCGHHRTPEPRPIGIVPHLPTSCTHVCVVSFLQILPLRRAIPVGSTIH